MLFPWVGMFEQLRLSDVFVFYDDVQFSKGSFTNRVQLKTAAGSEWMSLPLKKFRLGQHINEIELSENVDWRAKHLAQLQRHYAAAPYVDEMLALVEQVYENSTSSLAELTMASMMVTSDYFGLLTPSQVMISSEQSIAGKSSERVLDYVLNCSAERYITGMGALSYLNHELFESKGVVVEYMDYRKMPYDQLHDEFDPYVSILDLIANCGKAGGQYICSGTIGWREAVEKSL